MLMISMIDKSNQHEKPDRMYRLSEFPGIKGGEIVVRYRVCLTEFELGSFEILTPKGRSGILRVSIPRLRRNLASTDQRLVLSNEAEMLNGHHGHRIVKIRRHLFTDCTVFIRIPDKVLRMTARNGFLSIMLSDKEFRSLKKQLK